MSDNDYLSVGKKILYWVDSAAQKHVLALFTNNLIEINPSKKVSNGNIGLTWQQTVSQSSFLRLVLLFRSDLSATCPS